MVKVNNIEDLKELLEKELRYYKITINQEGYKLKGKINNFKYTISRDSLDEFIIKIINFLEKSYKILDK